MYSSGPTGLANLVTIEIAWAVALDVNEFDAAEGVRSVDFGRARDGGRSGFCFLDDDPPLVRVKVRLLGLDFLGESLTAAESGSSLLGETRPSSVLDRPHDEGRLAILSSRFDGDDSSAFLFEPEPDRSCLSKSAFMLVSRPLILSRVCCGTSRESWTGQLDMYARLMN
jgi:hypothetical protein